jgi:hypothetical protein
LATNTKAVTKPQILQDSQGIKNSDEDALNM